MSTIGKAIVQAADEVIEGKLADQFPSSIFASIIYKHDTALFCNLPLWDHATQRLQK